MGKSGNTNQVGKILRFRIHYHLHRKAGSELRYSETTEFYSVNVLRLNPENFRRLEQGHDFFRIQGDIFYRIQPR